MEPAREPAGAACGRGADRGTLVPRVLEPRCVGSSRRSAGHRGPARRPCDQPGPVRRDDRGDARPGGPGVRRGRAGRRADSAGRIDPGRPASPRGRLRRPRQARPGRLAARPGAAHGGRASRAARAADARPGGDDSSTSKPFPRATARLRQRPSTWMVNGSRARPLDAPEPRRLGQASTPAGPRDLTRGPSTRVTPVEAASRTSKPHHASSNGKAPAAPASMPVMPSTSALPSSDRSLAAPERVLAAFQETMQKFLEVQRTTMLAYLSGRQPLPAEPSGTPCRTPEVPERWAPPERAAPVPVVAATAPPRPPSHGAAAVVSSAGDGQASVPATAGREEIARKLLDIVRERTGYPLEVLRLELDLEAELGIDSIKRVEILGKLRDAFPQIGNASDPEAMDRLARREDARGHRRPRRAGDRQCRAAAATSSACTLDSPSRGSRGTRNGKVHDGIAPAAPGGGGRPARRPGERLDAGRHGAHHRGRPRDRGRLWPRRSGPGAGRQPSIGGPDSRLDWTSPAAVDERDSTGATRRAARGIGPPLAAPIGPRSRARPGRLGRPDEPRGPGALPAGEGTGRRSRGRRQARRSLPDRRDGHGGPIRQRRESRGRLLPRAGGHRGPDQDDRPRVDLGADPRDRPRRQARMPRNWPTGSWPRSSTTTPGRRSATAVPAGSGCGRSPRPWPRGQARPRFSLAPGEPVLITGGARGITSLVAAELARRWRPTLLLIGTTPPPDGSRRRRAGRADGPVRAQGRALRAAPPRRASRLAPGARAGLSGAAAGDGRSAGTSSGCGPAARAVEYAQVDVRDLARLAAVVNGWRRLFGEPVGSDPRGGADPRQAAPRQVPRVVRPRARHQARRGPEPGTTSPPRAAPVRGLLLVDRGAVRQPRPVGLRRGQRGPEQAGDLARSPLARPRRGADLGAVVGHRHGLRPGATSRLARAGHDLSRGRAWRPSMNELLRGRKGDVEVILAGDLGTLDAPQERTPAAHGGRADEARSGPRHRHRGHVAAGSPAHRTSSRSGPTSWPTGTARARSPPTAGRSRRSTTRTRRPTTAWPAGAAATSTRRSPSTRPRTGSCRWPSRGRARAVPGPRRGPRRAGRRRHDPGPSRRRRVEVVIGRGNYFNRGNLTRLQHGRIVAQTVGLLAALHPEWTSRGSRAPPTRPEGEPAAVRGRDDPRPAHQRDGRAARRPARPGRGQLRRRCRQRLVAGRPGPGAPGPRRTPRRPGAGGRGLPRGRRRFPAGLRPARRALALGRVPGRSRPTRTA